MIYVYTSPDRGSTRVWGESCESAQLTQIPGGVKDSIYMYVICIHITGQGFTQRLGKRNAMSSFRYRGGEGRYIHI